MQVPHEGDRDSIEVIALKYTLQFDIETCVMTLFRCCVSWRLVLICCLIRKFSLSEAVVLMAVGICGRDKLPYVVVEELVDSDDPPTSFATWNSMVAGTPHVLV